MFSKFKKHIMLLAVLAVALVQVFGMQAGYFCECTGEKTTVAVCETDCCHPEDDHATTDPDHHEDQDHQHKEVRGSLILAGLPPVLNPPVAVFFDLPPALQLPDFTALMASFSEKGNLEPPEYGSPPMPQMVARVIVLLVCADGTEVLPPMGRRCYPR